MPLVNGRRYLQMIYLIMGQYPKYTKNSYNSTSNKQTTWLKYWKRIWIVIFPRKAYRWLSGTWKDAQHNESSGKHKSKTQWDIISHKSEWLSSKRQQIASADEDLEKREPSCIVSGNVNWFCHYWKQLWRFLKILKVELPYDPAIPFLGIYLKKMKTLIQKDTCTPMFITALFTIAKIWK